MNSKGIPGTALVLCGALLGCSSVGREFGTFTPDQPPVTLGRALEDFNHDGDADTLSLIWVSGRHYEDEVPWCGNGEKYQGKFVFRVELAHGPTVATGLSSDDLDGHDFILASDEQPWRIVVADYNNDGQPDFNIVTYGGCDYQNCHLFAVAPSGKIEALKLAREHSLTLAKTGDHSTSGLSLTPKGLYHEYSCLEERTRVLEFLDWDARLRVFHFRRQAIKLRE